MAGSQTPPTPPRAALPFTLGELQFHSERNKLVAFAGKHRSVVSSVYRATSANGWRLSADRSSAIVTYRDAYTCGDPDEKLSATVDLKALGARMLNVEALEAHRVGEYARAASGFAAAVELDPEFELARSNLACALNKQGKRAEAIAALAPLIEKNPILAYSKVATDADLKDLGDAPEVQALRAAVPSAVHFGSDVLISASGRAVALGIHEPSWGAMSYKETLLVMDSRDGHEFLRTALVDWGDSDPGTGEIRPARRAEVQRRYDQLNAWLGELGFAPDPKARSFDAQAFARTIALPGTPFRMRFDEGGLQVLAGAREVARARILVRDRTRVTYLPGVHALALFWDIEAPEGCDMGDTVFGGLLALPP